MGSSPNWTYGYVPTAAQWNLAFSTKQDDLGYTPVNRAGDTMEGRLVTFSSVPERAGFNIQPGTAPDSPQNGDIWFTSTGIFAQVGGSTVGPISTGTVTSVGLTAPSEFDVTGSPVTSTGSLEFAWADQSANYVLAGPDSGDDAAPSFRLLVGDDLPDPGASSKGGVEAYSAPTNEFLIGVGIDGVPTSAEPDVPAILGYSPLDPANNLSDVDDAATARANLGIVTSTAPYRTTAISTAITSADSGGVVEFTVTGNATFSASATLTSDFRVEIWAPFGVTVTLVPNGSETINGLATLILRPGQMADVRCNGSNLFAKVTGGNYSGPQIQGIIAGLTLSNNVADATNDIDIAVGSAGSDTSPNALMVLSSALTKRLDAAWAVGTNQGGLDTGSIANTTYHVWVIRRSDTGVTDVCFSTSATAPTTGGVIPAAYDQKRRIGSIIRVSGAILGFVQDGDQFQLTSLVAETTNVNPGASAFTKTFTRAPTGIRVELQINIRLSAADYLAVTDLSVTDQGPSAVLPNGVSFSGASGAVMWAFSNTSAQCRARMSDGTAVTVFWTVRGWIDIRGK